MENLVPEQNEELRGNVTMLDGERSRNIAGLLRSSADRTAHLYGNDVKTAYQLLALVLQRESQQQGFELTATHDTDFNEVRDLTSADLALKGAVWDLLWYSKAA